MGVVNVTPDSFSDGGKYLDPDRVRPIDHRGTHFTVKGPLNISPTPQGRPVVFMAGQSGPGMELAARYADEFNLPFVDEAFAGAQFARVREACERAQVVQAEDLHFDPALGEALPHDRIGQGTAACTFLHQTVDRGLA